MAARRDSAAVTNLPGLGPASRAMLDRAGITSPEQLRRIGSVAAWLAVRRTTPGASLNLLWALEGALTNRHWTEVARTDRLDLLLQMDAMQQSQAGTPPAHGSGLRPSRRAR